MKEWRGVRMGPERAGAVVLEGGFWEAMSGVKEDGATGGNLEKGDEGGNSGFVGAAEGFNEANGLSEGFSSATAADGGIGDVDVVPENPVNGFMGGTEVVLTAVVVPEPLKAEREGAWKDQVAVLVIPENNPPPAVEGGAAVFPCCPNPAK